MFAGSAAPTGWLLCDGSAVSRTGNAALFAAIGTGYGIGDGSTTFNLPDGRGRTPIGAGQGAGLTNRALGAKAGEENHQLTTAELAAHAHAITDPGHNHTYTSPLNPSSGWVSVGGGIGSLGYVTGTSVTGISVQNAGSNTPHNNMQPSLAFNFIIKT
jgi:microcystin-dependent protein